MMVVEGRRVDTFSQVSALSTEAAEVRVLPSASTHIRAVKLHFLVAGELVLD
jgi:hypothetical protein